DDSVTDAEEQAFGTDPNNPDTDGDGATDGEEIAAGTDPLDPDSTPGLGDPDLVGWYQFASDDGGLIPDSSGNGHDGACSVGGTCPTFVSGDGQPAGAYDFVGAGNYIELDDESLYDFTREFSVALWMKADDLGNTWAQLIGKGDSAWSLDRMASTNQLSFTTWPGPQGLVGSTDVEDGQWHHVAIVYDGSQKILYVDGQIDAQVSYSAPVSTNDVKVSLGYNAEYPSGEYGGLLDEVRIYSRALSQADIQDVMTMTFGSPPVASIDVPVSDTLFRAGDVVSFTGSGTDQEDGALSSAAISWEVLFHHNGQTDQVLTLPGAVGGSFTVPTTGLDSLGDVRYEIELTVTDSDGLTGRVSHFLQPERVAITLTSSPVGVGLSFDSATVASPFSVDALVNYRHAIGAPNTGAGNELYEFSSWSDGGAQTHVIDVPSASTSYTATFDVITLDPSADEDGDGLLNGWEIQHGLDPFEPGDAQLDSDGDGLTNIEEQSLGTDPTTADSDDDSVTDAEEQAFGTDPNNPDTDGDGATDGEEIAAGTDPLDPGSTPGLGDPELVGWYEFASDNAGLIPDSSGNGHDGACSVGGTCPTFTTVDGQPAGSYDFTGNGNYIELPNESAFDFTTQFSVSLWMRSANPPNAWAQLVGKGDSAWAIERRSSTNNVSFTTFAPGPDSMAGSTNVFDGQWHHIAVVYDGSQKILYVDGQVDAQKSYSSTVSQNDLNVRLGFNSEYTVGQYDGLLDDVRIFSRPLSQPEVTAILNESSP
ncbi:MAG: hypothetical protein OER77_12295, partial [Myxococcales bacterium]|nr:hypothetical protein [Myxococcales bacterium]